MGDAPFSFTRRVPVFPSSRAAGSADFPGRSVTPKAIARITPPSDGSRKVEVHDPGNIDTMNISNGTVSGEVEYTEHQDGTWSFKLALDDDPVSIESLDNFPTKELAQEQVNYELQAASLRVAEG
jgi:hypothetical protein